MKLQIKTALITFVLTTIVYFVMAFGYPFAENGSKGTYNQNSGLLWCSDTQSCLHEIGHAMDNRMGRPSQTVEFKNAVNDYISKYPAIGFSAKVHSMPGIAEVKIPRGFSYYHPYQELYADMYAWASGCKCNMPVEFQKFYQWDN